MIQNGNQLKMAARIVFIVFILNMLLACSAGTVSVRNYSNANISALRTYAWYGLAQIEPDEFRSGSNAFIDGVEQQIRELLMESGYSETIISDAEILITLRIQFRNALNIESQYRQRASSDVFSAADNTISNTGSNVLLPDVDAPLFVDQQRGSLSLIIYDAKSKKPLKEGSTTVVFPQELDSQKQLTHLNKTLQRLIDRLFI